VVPVEEGAGVVVAGWVLATTCARRTEAWLASDWLRSAKTCIPVCVFFKSGIRDANVGVVSPYVASFNVRMVAVSPEGGVQFCATSFAAWGRDAKTKAACCK